LQLQRMRHAARERQVVHVAGDHHLAWAERQCRQLVEHGRRSNLDRPNRAHFARRMGRRFQGHLARCTVTAGDTRQLVYGGVHADRSGEAGDIDGRCWCRARHAPLGRHGRVQQGVRGAGAVTAAIPNRLADRRGQRRAKPSPGAPWSTATTPCRVSADQRRDGRPVPGRPRDSRARSSRGTPSVP
jgi:hypothetical protein